MLVKHSIFCFLGGLPLVMLELTMPLLINGPVLTSFSRFFPVAACSREQEAHSYFSRDPDRCPPCPPR